MMSIARFVGITCVGLLLQMSAVAAEPIPPGASYDVGFSPRGEALNVVLKGIHSAKSSILVAAYSFTSKPIALALLDAHNRGVKVQIVADKKSNRKFSATTVLANHGVPVRLNGHFSIFHHKFMVIDDENLETGSFNYSSAAANKNAENVLLLWHVKPLAETYRKEWQRLWDEGEPMEASY